MEDRNKKRFRQAALDRFSMQTRLLEAVEEHSEDIMKLIDDRANQTWALVNGATDELIVQMMTSHEDGKAFISNVTMLLQYNMQASLDASTQSILSEVVSNGLAIAETHTQLEDVKDEVLTNREAIAEVYQRTLAIQETHRSC
jgi:hypothetical protein